MPDCHGSILFTADASLTMASGAPQSRRRGTTKWCQRRAIDLPALLEKLLLRPAFRGVCCRRPDRPIVAHRFDLNAGKQGVCSRAADVEGTILLLPETPVRRMTVVSEPPLGVIVKVKVPMVDKSAPSVPVISSRYCPLLLLVLNSSVRMPLASGYTMGMPLLARQGGDAILQASPFMAELEPSAPAVVLASAGRRQLGF